MRIDQLYPECRRFGGYRGARAQRPLAGLAKAAYGSVGQPEDAKRVR